MEDNDSGAVPQLERDALHKQVFGNPGIAAELLKAHLPADLLARCDWTTLVPDDTVAPPPRAPEPL